MTLVTHNLEDVLEHSDVVTVFRDGQVVERRPTADWTKRAMVSAMLGKAIEISTGLSGTRTRSSAPAGVKSPALVVDALSSPGILDDISFELREGEILGIAGLVGSGRSSVLRALAGLDRQATGTVQVREQRPGRSTSLGSRGASPRHRIASRGSKGPGPAARPKRRRERHSRGMERPVGLRLSPKRQGETRQQSQRRPRSASIAHVSTNRSKGSPAATSRR